MTTAAHPYRIVVGVDFSDSSRVALLEAATIAATRGGELHPVYVLDDAPDPLSGKADIEALDRRFREASERGRDFIDSELATLTARLGGEFRQRLAFHVRAGAPARQLVEIASALDADLIVVATHGLRGLARLVMGSVSEKVLRLAHCPVLVVRPKDHVKAAESLGLEPPCPDCVKARETSNGEELWCPRHKEPHPHAHRFSYYPSVGTARDPLKFG